MYVHCNDLQTKVYILFTYGVDYMEYRLKLFVITIPFIHKHCCKIQLKFNKTTYIIDISCEGSSVL